MDLTEIMDFLDSLEEGGDKNVDNNYSPLTPQNLSPMNKTFLKAPKRSRANTWHGDDDDSIVLSDVLPSGSVNNSPRNGTPPKGIMGQGIVSRKSIARRNAWGNLSYADMITQAINSSAEKRMTLSEIYNWMVQNIPFFRDKGESNSSAGWKNSIRHNLSLHKCFMRVQNDGAGKSSWWVLNPDYRVTQPHRRRAATMDISKSPSLCHRAPKASSKKSEHITSPLADSTTADMPVKEGVDSCEELFSSCDLRPRSKTISIKFSKLSPTLEDQEEHDHTLMRRVFKGENASDVFYRNVDQDISRHQQAPNTPGHFNNLPFIPIPTPYLPAEVTGGSLPSGWNFNNNNNYPINKHLQHNGHSFNNTHSMNNIRAHMYNDNTGIRLLSGGNLVRGQVFKQPQHKFYNRPFNNTGHIVNNNNNNPYLKKCLVDNNQEAYPPSTKSLQMLMSGGLQVPSSNLWPPHYQQQQQQQFQQQHNKKDHALLMHLLTDKEQPFLHSMSEQSPSPHGAMTFQNTPNRPLNSPQHYSSMLQHLLTAGHKRSLQFPTPPGFETIHQRYENSSNNAHYQPPHQYPSRELPHQSDFNNPSTPYSSTPDLQHVTSPSHAYSDDPDSPTNNIHHDKYLSNSNNSNNSNNSETFEAIDPSKSSIITSDIPEDLASIDSIFSDIDTALVSPCNIEMSISQVIDLEKSLADPYDVDFLTDTFNFT